MQHESRVAVVTGGAKGVGKGCARVFAQEGIAIAIADLDESAGTATVREIEALGGTCTFIKCDVSKNDEVRAFIRRVVEGFGRLDILVNNAGYHISKSVEATSEEEWDYILNTNLKSVFLCSKYAIPHLRKTRGCIVNMASMVGLVGQAHAGAYLASQGGIIAMAMGMALDLAKDGIRVNCVCPGWVQTPLTEDYLRQQPDPEGYRKYIFGVHPLGRIATTEEIGRVVLFLCSEGSSFITGVAVPVDGGVTLGY